VKNYPDCPEIQATRIMNRWRRNIWLDPASCTRLLLCLALILVTPGFAADLRAEDTKPAQAEPVSDQYDNVYDAMLKSIELDKSRWKSFSRSMESGPWFYDAQGVKRKRAMVSVPVTVYPHPNKTELYRGVYQDHTKIRKIVFVTEINCAKHSYRQPLISVYGYFNELLAEHSAEGQKQPFSPIKAGTTTDTLRTLVCSDKKKRN